MGAAASCEVKEHILNGRGDGLLYEIESMFVDDEFPLNLGEKYSNSGFNGIPNDEIEWVRAPQVGGCGVLFSGVRDPCVDDIIAGIYSCPYFIAAIMGLTSRINYLRSHFISYNPYVGCAAIRLWYNSRYEIVIIDDKIPCRKVISKKSGNLAINVDGDGDFTYVPLFSATIFGDCWLPLLEKALAKLRGSSYSTLGDSSMSDVLVDMTGEYVIDTSIDVAIEKTSVAQSLYGTNQIPSYTQSIKIDAKDANTEASMAKYDDLFKILQSRSIAGSVILCADPHSNGYTAAGSYKNQAEGVGDVVKRYEEQVERNDPMSADEYALYQEARARWSLCNASGYVLPCTILAVKETREPSALFVNPNKTVSNEDQHDNTGVGSSAPSGKGRSRVSFKNHSNLHASALTTPPPSVASTRRSTARTPSRISLRQSGKALKSMPSKSAPALRLPQMTKTIVSGNGIPSLPKSPSIEELYKESAAAMNRSLDSTQPLPLENNCRYVRVSTAHSRVHGMENGLLDDLVTNSNIRPPPASFHNKNKIVPVNQGIANIIDLKNNNLLSKKNDGFVDTTSKLYQLLHKNDVLLTPKNEVVSVWVPWPVFLKYYKVLSVCCLLSMQAVKPNKLSITNVANVENNYVGVRGKWNNPYCDCGLSSVAHAKPALAMGLGHTLDNSTEIGNNGYDGKVGATVPSKPTAAELTNPATGGMISNLDSNSDAEVECIANTEEGDTVHNCGGSYYNVSYRRNPMYVLSLPTSTITNQSCRLYISLDTPDHRQPVADSLTLAKYSVEKTGGRLQYRAYKQKSMKANVEKLDDSGVLGGTGEAMGLTSREKRPIEPPVKYFGVADTADCYDHEDGVLRHSLSLTNYSNQTFRDVTVTQLPSTAQMRRLYMNQTESDAGKSANDWQEQEEGLMQSSLAIGSSSDVDTGVLLEDKLRRFEYVAIALNVYKYEPLFKYLLCQTPYRCKKNVGVELDLDSTMSELLVIPSTYQDNVVNGLFWLTATLVTLTTGKIYSIPFRLHEQWLSYPYETTILENKWSVAEGTANGRMGINTPNSHKNPCYRLVCKLEPEEEGKTVKIVVILSHKRIVDVANFSRITGLDSIPDTVSGADVSGTGQDLYYPHGTRSMQWDATGYSSCNTSVNNTRTATPFSTVNFNTRNETFGTARSVVTEFAGKCNASNPETPGFDSRNMRVPGSSKSIGGVMKTNTYSDVLVNARCTSPTKLTVYNQHITSPNDALSSIWTHTDKVADPSILPIDNSDANSINSVGSRSSSSMPATAHGMEHPHSQYTPKPSTHNHTSSSYDGYGSEANSYHCENDSYFCMKNTADGHIAPGVQTSSGNGSGIGFQQQSDSFFNTNPNDSFHATGCYLLTHDAYNELRSSRTGEIILHQEDGIIGTVIFNKKRESIRQETLSAKMTTYALNTTGSSGVESDMNGDIVDIVLMPCAWNEGDEGDFGIQVLSNKPCAITEYRP